MTLETTVKRIESLTINQYTKTKIRNMRDMHTAFASTGLLFKLLKQRTQPVPTASNSYGWRGPTIYHAPPTTAIEDDIDNDGISIASKESDTKTVILGVDDIGLYMHYKTRLMHLVQKMFSKSVHSFSEQHKINEDPIGFYKVIIKNVFGHRPRDMTNASNAFTQYAATQSISVADELVRWNEVVLTYNDLRKHAPITPDIMLAFLQRIYENDKRDFISITIYHGRLQRWDYNKTIAELIEMEQQLPMRKQEAVGVMANNKNNNNNKINNSNNNKDNQKDLYANNKDRGYCKKGAKWGNCATKNCTYRHGVNPNANPMMQQPRDSGSNDQRNDNRYDNRNENRYDHRNNNKRNDQRNNNRNNSNDKRGNNRSNRSDLQPTKSIMKLIPVDTRHRSTVAFAVNEENINLVGRPNGDHTAEGWSRTKLSQLQRTPPPPPLPS